MAKEGKPQEAQQPLAPEQRRLTGTCAWGHSARPPRNSAEKEDPFEDCMPVDGNKCAFNFSITNNELSNMGETSLEEPENYSSPDRIEDSKLKTDLEYRQREMSALYWE